MIDLWARVKGNTFPQELKLMTRAGDYSRGDNANRLRLHLIKMITEILICNMIMEYRYKIVRLKEKIIVIALGDWRLK